MRLKALFRWWFVGVTLTLILSYGTSFISPVDFWPSYFISLSIPVLIVFNSINIFISLFFKDLRLTVIPLIAAFYSFHDFNSTINFYSAEEKTGNNFSVLSYNVHVFNSYENLHKNDKSSSDEIINWVKKSNADVLCLQEYYDYPRSARYDVCRYFKDEGYTFCNESIVLRNKVGAKFGIAIFSKHPIIHGGTIHFKSQDHQNRANYTDIVINEDTIRIINVHLESFARRRVLLTEESIENNKRGVFQYFIQAIQHRAAQADMLDSLIRETPYEIIVCGDFNALPYEYPYKKINARLANAFVKKGSGFGFTRYGNPFPVRIDNQFFSNGLKLKSFKTLNNLRYSDHVPLLGVYSCN